MSTECVIQQHNGTPFYPLEPLRAPVDWNGVIISLGRLPRFTGHTLRNYTVLRHALAVACLADERAYFDGDPEVADLAFRAGLWHEVAEALGFNDLAAPVKHQPQMQWYRDAERECMLAVCETIGIPRVGKHWEYVAWADKEACALEKHQCLAPADWWVRDPETDFRVMGSPLALAEMECRKDLRRVGVAI